MTSPTRNTLLVTGANGKLGRKVVKLLLAARSAGVIAGSRTPENLSDLARSGAETRRVDFEDSASLEKAFAGVDRVLIISTDSLGETGRRERQHLAAIAAAKAAGVKHVVYTSMPRPEPGNAVSFAADHYNTEQALAAAGLGWTILRNNMYQENLLGSLPTIVRSGVWRSSAGDGGVAYVAHDDCAAAAAAALAADFDGQARYDISGPRALSTAELAEIVGQELGVTLRVMSLTDEQLAAGMAAAGVPPIVIPIMISFQASQRQGDLGLVSDDVKALTGRPPRDIREFLIANRQALAA